MERVHETNAEFCGSFPTILVFHISLKPMPNLAAAFLPIPNLAAIFLIYSYHHSIPHLAETNAEICGCFPAITVFNISLKPMANYATVFPSMPNLAAIFQPSRYSTFCWNQCQTMRQFSSQCQTKQQFSYHQGIPHFIETNAELCGDFCTITIINISLKPMPNFAAIFLPIPNLAAIFYHHGVPHFVITNA